MRWGNTAVRTRKNYHGFTLVEVLIITIVIGILSLITIVAFNGIQLKARQTRVQNDISTVHKIINVYRIENGQFPVTTNNSKANWRAADVRTDSNCPNESSQADWIPGVTASLPISASSNKGVDGIEGCYIYVSDGVDYVVSAWNMATTLQSASFYRRIGFREFQSDSSTQFYTCNVNGVGGVSGGTYDINQDYYKHSYTVSNITSCDENPPTGA